MSNFRSKFLQPASEKERLRKDRLDPRKMGPVGERQFEEQMLAHFDELGDIVNYKAQLKRMREQGMEPMGSGKPQPGSPLEFYGK